MKKDIIAAGPAISAATSPVKTYTPLPNMHPMPTYVRSAVDRHRTSAEVDRLPEVVLFLRVMAKQRSRSQSMVICFSFKSNVEFLTTMSRE